MTKLRKFDFEKSLPIWVVDPFGIVSVPYGKPYAEGKKWLSCTTYTITEEPANQIIATDKLATHHSPGNRFYHYWIECNAIRPEDLMEFLGVEM